MTGPPPSLPLFTSDEKDALSEESVFRQLNIMVQHVWKNDISRGDVEEWLANFTGRAHDKEYERQLALWMLSHFVYYNEQEVRHLCRTLFHDFLHWAVSAPTASGDVRGTIGALLAGTRFYFLGAPGESGSYVLYYFRQENHLGVHSFLSSHGHVPDHVERVVFVDDVTLSSEQATKYLAPEKTGLDLAGRQSVLLTFLATPHAIKTLTDAGLIVLPAIVLDERCQCFTKESSMFHGVDEHRQSARVMAECYGKTLFPEHPLGYRDGQYAFGFFYNTPNDTLPLFWSDADHWKAIMRRYDKLMLSVVETAHDRFV